MIAALVASLVLPNPYINRHWMDDEPKSVVSKSWQQNRSSAQSEMARLQQLSSSARLNSINKQIAKVKQARSPENYEIYLLANITVNFFPELYNTQASEDIEQVLWRNSGTNDPEFMRMAYAALCRKRSPGRWKLLGVKLRKIFQGDLIVNQAFVRESIFGELPLNYAYEARTLFNRDLKSTFSTYAFTDLSANLEMNLYFRTKRKVHLDEAIKNLDKLITLQTNRREDTKNSKIWLTKLKKKLSEKDFID